MSFVPFDRAGEVPFNLTVELKPSGIAPYIVTFIWGDGAEDEVITSFSPVSRTHEYTSAGNFSLELTIQDDSDIRWSYSWPVSAYVPGYSGVISYNVFMEGLPSATDLYQQVGSPREFSVIVHNTGDALIQSLEVVRHSYTQTGTNCWQGTAPEGEETVDFLSPIPPGSYAYAIVDYETFGSAGDSLYECISVYYPRESGFTANVTVEYNVTLVQAVQTRSLSGSVTPSIRSTTVGLPATYTLSLTNTGDYLIELLEGDVILSGAPAWLSISPENPATFGLFNGTFWAERVDQPLHILTGETVNIPFSVLPEAIGTESFTWTITPRGVNDTLGSAIQVETTIQSREGTGATIATLTADVISSTRVELSGKVISLGGSSWVDVWFQYRSSTSEIWSITPSSPVRISDSGRIVQRVISLDANTNYIYEFVGQTSGGSLVYGGQVSFSTAEADEPRADFGSWLEVLGRFTNTTREVWGYIFGTLLIFLAIAVMNLDRWSFEVRWQIQLIVILVLVLVNVFLFLWNVGIVIVIAIISGIMVVREIRSTGGAHSG